MNIAFYTYICCFNHFIDGPGHKYKKINTIFINLAKNLVLKSRQIDFGFTKIIHPLKICFIQGVLALMIVNRFNTNKSPYDENWNQ